MQKKLTNSIKDWFNTRTVLRKQTPNPRAVKANNETNWKELSLFSNQQKQFQVNTTQHSWEASLSQTFAYHDDERDFLHLENEAENIGRQTYFTFATKLDFNLRRKQMKVSAARKKLNGWLTRRMFNYEASV